MLVMITCIVFLRAHQLFRLLLLTTVCVTYTVMELVTHSKIFTDFFVRNTLQEDPCA